ncbi:LLM class F420-dependent oxidoreductase [Rhodococcus wratislaviensis]|uniref:LLM class F420-dependent oxidoreductase n=1 Tax=Rhodococcus wratislaviensis TaxID=44752 RepID=UPI00365A5CDC
MRIGVVFPQTEIGSSGVDLQNYGQSVEKMGFRHILAYEHVVGADPTVHKGWTGAYDLHSTFHEPMVMFGYLAAVTTTIELVTGVVVLPQRQTALVAKQAAEIDLLSDGRLRLGVGVGWNRVEYEALGEDFTNRGRRAAEQIDVLRRLWTEESFTYEGQYHRITGAGLAPRPLQRPIPVWLGGNSVLALERVGRLADGWFPQVVPGPELDKALQTVERAAGAAGRDPSTIGMEGQVAWNGEVNQVIDGIGEWVAAGASHIAVNTMDVGLGTLDEHLDVLHRVAEQVPELVG